MLVGMTSVFFVSLAGIIGLFVFKLWEERRERAVLPRFRLALDAIAYRCKELANAGEAWLSRAPSSAAALVLSALASSAVGFAHLARAASEAAHKLADFVSHKRNFTRRETKSEFLKKVTEHKNSNGANGKKLL